MIRQRKSEAIRRPIRILVVEDNEESREILSRLLRLCGYEVEVAFEGESGYNAAIRHNPDLIITDVEMPIADGIALIERVRSQPALGGIPIIVVTAVGEEAMTRALAAGATVGVEKPFDFDDFLLRIRGLLSSKTPGQESRSWTEIH